MELESERECSSCFDLPSMALVQEIGRMCRISYDHGLHFADARPKEIGNTSESVKNPCTMSNSNVSWQIRSLNLALILEEQGE